MRNCKFTNNTAKTGGAVYFYLLGAGTVSDCDFTGNNAAGVGAAIYFRGTGSVVNCNFADNAANGNAGALYFRSTRDYVNVINCDFTGNNASAGSAIYFTEGSVSKTLTNCILLDNRVNAALQVTKNEKNLTIVLTGNDNLLTAIYSLGDVTFHNVTYYGVNGITNTDSSSIKPSRYNLAYRQNITVIVYEMM